LLICGCCLSNEADLRGWWWSDDELSKPAEILRDCGECELELGTARPTQSQTTKPQDALEMGKEHLNAAKGKDS
jgi:hypothetical protein